MEKKIIEQRFNVIAPHFRNGDAVRLSEMTGKTQSACRLIITKMRKPQEWFILAAEKYLKAIGRIPTERKVRKITRRSLREFSQRRDSLRYDEVRNTRESNLKVKRHYERLEVTRQRTSPSDDHGAPEDPQDHQS